MWNEYNRVIILSLTSTKYYTNACFKVSCAPNAMYYDTQNLIFTEELLVTHCVSAMFASESLTPVVWRMDVDDQSEHGNSECSQ